MQSRYDIAIIGGGPAGLSCAALASAAGFSAVVIEKESEASLAAPEPDGRDIALTHRSKQILEGLGVWQTFPESEIGPITRAAVRNGPSEDLLSMDPPKGGPAILGYLIGNNVIRQKIYERVKQLANVDLVAGVGVADFKLGASLSEVRLENGAAVNAPLVVAADSRFSTMRRKAGIGAEMRDFGRVCIVCRMTHELPHDGTAYEWFDTEQTIAVLPLHGGRESSIVITLPSDAANRAMGLDAAEYAADVQRRFKSKWGRMGLIGKRHAYPLVAVFAHRFNAQRFALVGDAAVGMHPVTAHGFNFGLRGADRLVTQMTKAARVGGDIGSERVLEAYATEHRRATYPLYFATNAMVDLYSRKGPLAGLAREALLRVGNVVSPIKGLLIDRLTEHDGIGAPLAH